MVCQLDNGEQMITEKGSMVWMSPNIRMKTQGGGLGKMFSKAFSGESMFQNIYTANGSGMIVQKSALLVSESGVELSIHFSRNSAQTFSAARDCLTPC